MSDGLAELNPKATQLGSQKLSKLIFSYASTIFIGLLLSSIYNLTDSLFISWGVNVNASGAISIVLPFVLIQSAISTALGGGAAALVSIKLGKGKPNEAGEITLNAMIAFYVTAIAVTIIGFVAMENLLKIMGVTDELYPYAKKYFTIILAGNVFSTGFSSIIRAEGKMLYGLLIWVIPICINVVLDAVFIFALHWDVAGSALATVICQMTSFSMMVIFFSKFTTQKFKNAKIGIRQIAEILQIGISSLVQMSSLSIMALMINYVLSKASGTTGVNTFAFLNKIISFLIIPFMALSQGIMPIVGFNYGKGNLERVTQTLKFAVFVAFVYSVLALVICQAIPKYFMMIFTNNTAIISTGENAIRILACSLIFMPFSMLIGSFYQAQGKKLSALLLYSTNLLFIIPFIFTLYKPMGINGVWLSYVLSAILSAITATMLAFLKYRKTKNDIPSWESADKNDV